MNKNRRFRPFGRGLNPFGRGFGRRRQADLIPKIYTIVRVTHLPATVVFLIKAFLLDSRSLTRELVAYKNLTRYGEINA